MLKRLYFENSFKKSYNADKRRMRKLARLKKTLKKNKKKRSFNGMNSSEKPPSAKALNVGAFKVNKHVSITHKVI